MATRKKKVTGAQNIDTVQQLLNQEAMVPESFELFGSALSPSSARTPFNSRSRQNYSGSKEQRFPYINDGIIPFEQDNEGNISIRDSIELCQKAYFNFAAFGNTIDIMSEFANAELRWSGKNKAALDFIRAWAEKINLWKVRDQFFREYYLSGNYISYRIDGTITPEDVSGYKEVYGKIKFTEDNTIKIPLAYITLNPKDIFANGSLNYLNPIYLRSFNVHEIKRLLNPKTEEDKELANSIGEDILSKFKNVKDNVLIPLDPARLYTIFYKKQDYYPMSIPFGYRVLDDINYKLELRRTDANLARTVEHVILLVTTGTEPDKGGINTIALEALKSMFKSESMGRVLVADYTTDAKFVIPDIAAILGPQKYEAVNQDIKEGLMNIFLGEEKFSNTATKIRVFVERLQNAQQVFLREFLMPEVRRICKIMGFKGDLPKAEFVQVDIKDELQYGKIYTSLAQAGFLTPEETFEALKSGALPSPDESLESQKRFKQYKEQDLYKPQINQKEENGRPSGSTGTKTPNRQTRVLGNDLNENNEIFSIEAIATIFKTANKIINNIQDKYLKDNKKRKVTPEIEGTILNLSKSLFYNEKWYDWEKKWEEYYNSPKLTNNLEFSDIDRIVGQYQVSDLLAVVLWNAKKENYAKEN